jgi:hypothetical protein
MLTVTSGFKTAIKGLAPYSNAKVDYVGESATVNFTSDDIKSFEISGSAIINDKVLGNIAQHSLTLELLGDKTSDIVLSDISHLEPYVGVKVGSAYEYVKQQNFIVTEVSYSDTTNITKVIATDYLVKLNNDTWVDNNTYPMTLKAYLESALTHCGLTLENTTFLNSSFSVASQPISDYTSCKEIVKRVAEMALSFIVINKVSNKFELRSAFIKVEGTHAYLSSYTHTQLHAYTHTQLQSLQSISIEQLNKDPYSSLKLNDHNFGTLGINTLVLKISQVDGENNTKVNATNVAIDGNVEIAIVDNPFINTNALRLSVIDAMFAIVDTYKFQPYALDYRGFAYLELGDIIKVTKMDNSTINIPIYETYIKFNGGVSGRLVAKTLSKSQTSFKYVSSNQNAQRGVEVKVDKVSGEFTILSGKYNNGELVGAKYTFDGSGATFTNGGLVIKNNAGTTVFTADVNGDLDITGKITATSGKIGRLDITSGDIYYVSDEFAKQYDNNDVVRLRRVLAGLDTQTPYDLLVYDINNTGTLTTTDLVQLRAIVAGTQANPNKMIKSIITIGKTTGEVHVTSCTPTGYLSSFSSKLWGDRIVSDGAVIKYADIEEVAVDSIKFGEISGNISSKTLTDYSEGTWTPTYDGLTTSPTVTYATTNNGGKYIRIGNLVTVTYEVRTTARTGGSGGLIIRGLPYARSSSLEPDTDKGSVQTYNVTYTGNSLIGLVGAGEDFIRIKSSTSGTTASDVLVTGVMTGVLSFTRGSLSYFVD